MSEDNKTRVSVMIYGTEYKLMGRASKSAAYLQMIAAQVNEQMHTIAEKAPHLDMPRIAVLTAVNIADELHELKENLKAFEQEEHKALRAQEQQMDKLATENEKLKQDVAMKDEQLNDSKRDRQQLQQDLVQLRDEHKQLQAELKQQLLVSKREGQQDGDIMEKYQKLEEEYKKLQSEYNEWIQLIEREDPVS